MSSFKTILVPVDFSVHSEAALEAALQFARLFDSKIHLIHCYQIQPGGISPYGIAIPSNFFTELRDAAKKQLEEWKAKHLPEGISAETTVASESPAEAIVEIAESIGADLIVMGTRGLTGLKHVMLGSVAERTVRLAKCPVMTINAPDPEEE